MQTPRTNSLWLALLLALLLAPHPAQAQAPAANPSKRCQADIGIVRWSSPTFGLPKRCRTYLPILWSAR